MYVTKDIFLILVIVNANKSCGIGEYLNYSNCTCRKKFFDKLIEECTENFDVIKIDNENEHKKECSSCIVYIVFFFQYSLQ